MASPHVASYHSLWFELHEDLLATLDILRARISAMIQPMLVVMTGLPCTGKSTIASAVANALQAPIFSVDPMEAVLIKGGIGREQRSDYLAYDLAALLAEEQVQRGQPAVVDAVNRSTTSATGFSASPSGTERRRS